MENGASATVILTGLGLVQEKATALSVSLKAQSKRYAIDRRKEQETIQWPFGVQVSISKLSSLK